MEQSIYYYTTRRRLGCSAAGSDCGSEPARRQEGRLAPPQEQTERERKLQKIKAKDGQTRLRSASKRRRDKRQTDKLAGKHKTAAAATAAERSKIKSAEGERRQAGKRRTKLRQKKKK